jgi:hypothetical protein
MTLMTLTGVNLRYHLVVSIKLFTKMTSLFPQFVTLQNDTTRKK